MERRQLHNVTVYVEKSDLERTRDFYVALVGGEPVWEEAGYIACVGSGDVAVCVHETEPGHPAGAREFFFHGQDLDAVADVLEAAGVPVRRTETAGGDEELHCVDPVGNQIRVHAPKSSKGGPGPGISVLVPVSDVGKALFFYGELLGLTVDQVSEDFATLRAGDAFLWLHRDGRTVAPAGVELWVSINDIDGTHERLLAAGLADLRAPGDVHDWGLRVMSVPDPDGRRVYCFRPTSDL